MSLFEWLGESYNPGPIGSINSNTPSYKKLPRYQVIIKFIVSISIVGYITYLVLSNVTYLDYYDVILTLLAILTYSLLGFYLDPKPDYSNMGLMGGLIDHPFRYSDDINRNLLFIKIILWPGRFISISIRDFYILSKNIKR